MLEQLRLGTRLVLATVIRTSGSTPQKPGSSAIFSDNNLLAGTVGGGILEGEVQHIASSVLITGVSNHYYFNLDTDQGSDGAICGGEAIVLIDANPGAHLKTLEQMEQSLSIRQEGFLITAVNRKEEHGRTIERFWVNEESQYALPPEWDSALKDAVANHLKGPSNGGFFEYEPSSLVRTPYEMIFFEAVKPMARLVIAGAGHVGKALAHIGSLLDFEISVIDDRSEYANQGNIPDADHIIVQDIGKSMSELKTGSDTYIVIVTRGHNHDSEALKPCIGSDSAYVGMIGSTHKVGIIKKRFLEEGWATPEQWSKIHTPIGLAIGSKSVQEIAISIAAQLVSVRHKINKTNAG